MKRLLLCLAFACCALALGAMSSSMAPAPTADALPAAPAFGDYATPTVGESTPYDYVALLVPDCYIVWVCDPECDSQCYKTQYCSGGSHGTEAEWVDNIADQICDRAGVEP